MKNIAIGSLVVLVAGVGGLFLYKKFTQVETSGANISVPVTAVSGDEKLKVASNPTGDDEVITSATSSLPFTLSTYGKKLPAALIVKSNDSLFLVRSDRSVRSLISFDVPNPLLPLPFTSGNKYGDLYLGAKLSPDKKWVVSLVTDLFFLPEQEKRSCIMSQPS